MHKNARFVTPQQQQQQQQHTRMWTDQEKRGISQSIEAQFGDPIEVALLAPV
jgi:hypothetical protein